MKTLLAVIPADTRTPLGIRQKSKKPESSNFLRALKSYEVYSRADFMKKYPNDLNPFLEAMYRRGSSYIHVAMFELLEGNVTIGHMSYNGKITSSFRKMMSKYKTNDNMYTKIYEGDRPALTEAPSTTV